MLCMLRVNDVHLGADTVGLLAVGLQDFGAQSTGAVSVFEGYGTVATVEQLKARIVVCASNFSPEVTGTAPYTGRMCVRLARLGYEVHVLTTFPHYPSWKISATNRKWKLVESTRNLKISRFLHFVPKEPTDIKRLISEITFGFRIVMTRTRGADSVLLVTPALFSGVLFLLKRRFLVRQVPVVIWVQDLYAKGLNEIAMKRRAARVIRWVESWAFRQADSILVIHERFATILARDYHVPRDKIQVMRNWTHLPQTDTANDSIASKVWARSSNSRLVVHSGNMGKKQGLENVVDTAKLAEQTGSPLRILLVGDGSERKQLELRAGGCSTIKFLDTLPEEQFISLLKSADCLLVNEAPGVAEMSLPSKLTSYFAAARPIVAAASAHGITAQEISLAGAGVVVAPGNPGSLLRALEEICADKKRANQLGSSADQYFRASLSEDAAVKVMLTVLEQLRVSLH